MLKSIFAATLLLALLTVAGCESVSAPQAAAPKGTPIGDTGIRVSGSMHAGGSTAVR